MFRVRNSICGSLRPKWDRREQNVSKIGLDAIVWVKIEWVAFLEMIGIAQNVI